MSLLHVFVGLFTGKLRWSAILSLAGALGCGNCKFRIRRNNLVTKGEKWWTKGEDLGDEDLPSWRYWW